MINHVDSNVNINIACSTTKIMADMTPTALRCGVKSVIAPMIGNVRHDSMPAVVATIARKLLGRKPYTFLLHLSSFVSQPASFAFLFRINVHRKDLKTSRRSFFSKCMTYLFSES